MQTSLRSSYQYYDYATLDYSTRGQQNHDQESQHDHHHLQNIQLPENHLQQQQLQQQHHHHHLHHQQQIQDTCFEEQTDCYRDATQSSEHLPAAQEQLYVYNQPNYQLLDANQHLISGTISGDNNNNNDNNSVNCDKNNNNNNDDDADEQATENHYLVAQVGTCQPQEASNYQHVYYEPINFNSTCASEQHQLLHHHQQQQQQQHQLVENETQQALDATGQLISVPTTTTTFATAAHEQQQQVQVHAQAGLLPDGGCANYFQYHQQIEELPTVTTAVRQDDSILQLLDHRHQVPFHVQEANHSDIQGAEQPLANFNHVYQNGGTCAELVVHRPQHQQVAYQELETTINYQYTNHELLNETMASRAQSTGASNRSTCTSSLDEEENDDDDEEEDEEDEEEDEDDDSESGSTLTRDEKRAREANIPLSYYQIVNLTIDKFNEQLAKYNLSESQLTLIKDIRRRGKNKVAAQSCRKRKMEQINELQHEVSLLSNRRKLLACECSQLSKEHDSLVQEYNKIYSIIKAQSGCF